MNKNGCLDTGFEGGGVVIFEESATNDEIIDRMTLQPDGKILLLGRRSPESFLTLWRFHKNGVLDTCFGHNGWAKQQFADVSQYYETERVNSSGTLDAVAAMWISGESDLAVLRYILNDPDNDGLADAWSSGPDATPATPDRFCFVDTNAATNATVASNEIVITGIAGSVPVSVSGGQWQRNGGIWTANAGTVQNGDVLRVHHTAATTLNATTRTTLSVGGVSEVFTSKTASAGGGGGDGGGETQSKGRGGPISPVLLLGLLALLVARGRDPAHLC